MKRRIHQEFLFLTKKQANVPKLIITKGISFRDRNDSLEPQTTISKWMFGETTISYMNMGIIQLKQPFINGWPWGSRRRLMNSK